MTRLLLLLALAAAPGTKRAAAEPPNVAAMLDSMQGRLRECEGVPGPASVRVALVVWPDGAWTIGLAEFLSSSPNGEIEAKAKRCLEGWAAEWHRREPHLFAHPAPTLYTRRLEVPSSEAYAVARLDAMLGEVQHCRRVLRPPIGETVAARVRVTLEATGAVTFAPLDVSRHPLAKALFECAARQLGGLNVGLLEAPVVLERELAITRRRVRLPNSDGRPGALCSIGAWRRAGGEGLEGDDELVAPAACGPGLLCCSGGAAGSDGHCFAGQRCPLVP